MAVQESSQPRPSTAAALFGWAVNIIALALFALMCYLVWPFVLVRFQGAQPPALALPTAEISRQTAPHLPAAAPLPVQNPGGSYNDPNAADRAYATAAALTLATPVPNMDNTGDTAPVQLEQRTFDRQPAGDNVPTAEPAPVVNDAFGSKELAPPVNIQETHECKHGQVWRDGEGCKNP